MKLIHTADWQIGMRADSLAPKAGIVREARLESARRVVQIAQAHQVDLILLTGDVFEDNAIDRLLVRKIGDILRAFTGPVVIIPGNHDPLGPGSVWEHPVWQEAKNIVVCRERQPWETDHCILFPCPLHEKYSSKDPTAWIQAQASTKLAIGLAHGSVEGLASGESDFPIPRDAPARLGLDYLALGHWHSFARYDDPSGSCRMAYAGTHETTKFGERDSGNAVLVEISGRGAIPRLTPIRTGGLAWLTFSHSIQQPATLSPLLQQLQEVEKPGSALVRVRVDGILFPDDRPALRQLDEILRSRFLFGMLDTASLRPAPEGDAWIARLPAGPFRQAAEKLWAQALHAPEPRARAVANQALWQLFDLSERSSA